MKKANRILVILVMTIMMVMTLTACGFTREIKDKDISVKWNEKEAYLYTNKTCRITLKFSVRDGDNASIIEKDKGTIYKKGTTYTFKVEELAPGYLTEQAIIQEVNAYRLASISWVWIVIVIIVFLMIAPKLCEAIEGPGPG